MRVFCTYTRWISVNIYEADQAKLSKHARCIAILMYHITPCLSEYQSYRGLSVVSCRMFRNGLNISRSECSAKLIPKGVRPPAEMSVRVRNVDVGCEIFFDICPLAVWQFSQTTILFRRLNQDGVVQRFVHFLHSSPTREIRDLASGRISLRVLVQQEVPRLSINKRLANANWLQKYLGEQFWIQLICPCISKGRRDGPHWNEQMCPPLSRHVRHSPQRQSLMLWRLALPGKVRVDRGADGEEGEAGQVRRGLIHCQALAQGQEGQVVLQEPGTEGSWDRYDEPELCPTGKVLWSNVVPRHLVLTPAVLFIWISSPRPLGPTVRKCRN